MRVFLHIGAHKTATTAIQSAFDIGSKNLRSLGVIYPQSNWYHHAQHRLAFAMRHMGDPKQKDKPNLDAEISELNRAIAQCDRNARVFVSSEEMFSAPYDSIVALRDGLRQSEVRIVAFVRRPDDLFLSIYNQHAKDPGNSFTATVEKSLENPLRLHPDLAASECIENWTKVFGRERIFLRRYEDRPPLDEILQILELPSDAVPVSPEANRSVPAAVAEVMRIAKAVGMEPELRRKLYKVANQVFLGHPRLELGSESRRRILALMQPDFDSLFKKFDLENVYRPDLVRDESLAPTVLPPVRLLAKVLEAQLTES